MAESKVVINSNGQELQVGDVNQLSDTAAYADDRVFSEFLRMVPFNGATVTKAVLPYARLDLVEDNTDPDAIVGVPASGLTVTIRPFRAFIGPRTAVGTDSKKNWRDIRSSIYLGSTTTLNGSVAIATAHASLARIDLVYAAVAVDANSPTVTRYIKDPTTSVVSATSVVSSVVTNVSVAVVTGTANANPATTGFPVIPSDGAGIYYIPLAYVMVAPTATGLSQANIYTVAPCIQISRVTGVSVVRPASGQNKLNAGSITTAALNAWANSSGGAVQPKTYLPPTATGAVEMMIALDLASASSASWSHPIYGTIDDSRDWRRCLFFSWAQASDSTASPAGVFAWEGGTVALTPRSAFGMAGIGATPGTYVGSGQSFQDQLIDGAGGYAGGNNGRIAFQANQDQLNFTASGSIYIYVDASTGALKFYQTGSAPRAYVFIMLKAYGPIQSW